MTNQRIEVTVGERFGRWTVLGEVAPIRTAKMLTRKVECRCDCGTERILHLAAVRNGRTNSCGCFRHQMSNTPEYRTWQSIKERCERPSTHRYPAYGAKGITVCKQWSESFAVFFADMGPRPEGTSIDRVDNDRGYEPDNCRWATNIEQQRNRRNNCIVTFQGQRMTAAEFCEKNGIPHSCVTRYRKKGIDGDEIVSRRASRTSLGKRT